MTDEEIKKLAESYIDELFADDDMSDQDNIEDKNDALVMCMAFAGHILKKHCIVEKEKVLKLHQHWADRIRHTSSSRQMYRSRQIGAEEIFGKEMFEENKK